MLNEGNKKQGRLGIAIVLFEHCITRTKQVRYQSFLQVLQLDDLLNHLITTANINVMVLHVCMWHILMVDLTDAFQAQPAKDMLFLEGSE